VVWDYNSRTSWAGELGAAREKGVLKNAREKRRRQKTERNTQEYHGMHGNWGQQKELERGSHAGEKQEGNRNRNETEKNPITDLGGRGR